MPGRAIPLVTGEFYHLYNRGSEKKEIFIQTRDFNRFLKTFYYYQFLSPKPKFSKFTKSNLFTFIPDPDKKLVDVICFCLMPNHFHFLVKQLKEGGISIFMSQLANSYTRYFNTKYNRIGPLVQGTFKAVHIETDEQLLHLSRYIHLNPIVSGLVNSIEDYPWSSYREFINGQTLLCMPQEVLAFFPASAKYEEFVKDQIDYGQSLELIKHHLIDMGEDQDLF